MSLIRVYINKKIKKGFLDLDNPQTHYLSNVMRLKNKDSFNIFNENDGEWRASVSSSKKNSFTIKVENFIGIQPKPADIWVLFAPVKSLRVDFISQKITELDYIKMARKMVNGGPGITMGRDTINETINKDKNTGHGSGGLTMVKRNIQATI